MSVSPRPEDLPSHRQPRWLFDMDPQHFFGATGATRLAVWKMGEGSFEEAAVTEDLLLIPDSPDHGVLGPVRRMNVADLQSALAATQTTWEEWRP